MSTRTLQREFRAATGQAPYEWIVGERVARARELLESTVLAQETIAGRVGIGSVESLRHHFRMRLGTTPARYRARFASREIGRARERKTQ